MDSQGPAGAMPAQLAKGALRRLAQAQLEPTPANYARAYAEQAGETLPPEGWLPTRARAMVDRLATRVTDDAGLRTELASALMEARYDDLQRALERSTGQASAAAQSWAQLIDRLARGLDRGSRQWTGARKKDSLQRVLDGSGSDARRLQLRLGQLIAAWESDRPDDGGAGVAGSPARSATLHADRVPGLPAPDAVDAPAAFEPAGPADGPGARNVPNPPGASEAPDAIATSDSPAALETSEAPEAPEAPAASAGWQRIVAALQLTVGASLPATEPRAIELADELAALARRVAVEGARPSLVDALVEACGRAQRWLGLRHELVIELLAMCASLTEGLTDLAEPGSWTRAQGEGLRQDLLASGSARAVRAARSLLDDARASQRALQSERLYARDALKQMVRQVLSELGDLSSVTGHFNDKVSAYAEVIESADSLASLAEVVHEMVGESRAVHELVAGARERLATEHARGAALEIRVLALEAELRRLADEVSTDALTQVANRRGLAQAFTQESARSEREGSIIAPLAVGLIDIDNFKRLNDSLGHAAGDVALQSLAARVKAWLRPVDHLARFGGEEFVVLLPATAVAEAQQVLTRLQRRLSASLFMHQGQEVFVTFSAGVTAWRVGETLDSALARADEGLYEAKRSGKNRSCIA